jgi:hypothetical protein
MELRTLLLCSHQPPSGSHHQAIVRVCVCVHTIICYVFKFVHTCMIDYTGIPDTSVYIHDMYVYTSMYMYTQKHTHLPVKQNMF